MAYETLMNSTFNAPVAVATNASSVKKPNYTPAKTIKKAYKLVRKFFKQTKSKHQKFLNETIDAIDASDEEFDNLENERREAEAAAASAADLIIIQAEN